MKEEVPGYGYFRLGMGRRAAREVAEHAAGAVEALETPAGDILIKFHDRTIELLFHEGILLYQVIVRFETITDDGYATLVARLRAKYGETTGVLKNGVRRPRLSWTPGGGRYEIDCFPSGGGCTIHYTDMINYRKINASV